MKITRISCRFFCVSCSYLSLSVSIAIYASIHTTFYYQELYHRFGCQSTLINQQLSFTCCSTEICLLWFIMQGYWKTIKSRITVIEPSGLVLEIQKQIRKNGKPCPSPELGGIKGETGSGATFQPT